jgi:hypothetical protein
MLTYDINVDTRKYIAQHDRNPNAVVRDEAIGATNTDNKPHAINIRITNVPRSGTTASPIIVRRQPRCRILDCSATKLTEFLSQHGWSQKLCACRKYSRDCAATAREHGTKE